MAQLTSTEPPSLSLVELDWVVRATRIAAGYDTTSALMHTVQETARGMTRLWLEDVYEGFHTKITLKEVCRALEGLALGEISSTSVSLAPADFAAIASTLTRLGCSTPTRWSWTEIRMLRRVFNAWRRRHGYPEISDVDEADSMVRNWLSSRNAGPLEQGVPSEEELCLELAQERAHAESRRVFAWQTLQEKLGCGTPIEPDPYEMMHQELERKAPPTPKTSVQAALAPVEARLVGWLLNQGWYDKREDAVAHVMRMRKAGVFEKWKRFGRQGLDGVEMLADVERYRRSA